MSDPIRDDFLKYYRIIESSSILKKVDTEESKRQNPLIQAALEAIVLSSDSNGQGVLGSLEISEKIKTRSDYENLSEEDKKKIKIISSKGVELGTFKDTSTQKEVSSLTEVCNSSIDTTQKIAPISPMQKEGTKISFILSSSPFITPAFRDVDRITAFMNTIPSIELSRAVPFLDVKLEVNRFGESSKYRFPSNVKFLLGAAEIDSGSIDYLLSPESTQRTKAGKVTQYTAATTSEIFFSPQTLYSPLANRGVGAAGDLRAVNVLDPFRPFLSIKNLDITITPAGVGVFAHKTANMELVLHDKSRLSEISDLIKPEVFSRTSFSISYGWSHPDSTYDLQNIYGGIINSMRVEDEKYGITNSSFSIGQDGQVSIKLNLATRGIDHLSRISIVDSAELNQINERLDELLLKINTSLETLGVKKPDVGAKQLRVYEYLEKGFDYSEIQFENGYTFDKFITDIEAITKSSNAGDRADLIDSLKQAFAKKDSKSGKSGEVIARKEKITVLIKNKIQKLKTTPDPFLLEEDNIKRDSKNIVSLGKLIAHFVGIPMQSRKDFGEVQFVYYNFNESAGAAADINISSFPIEIDYLEAVFEDYLKTNKVAVVTIQQFISLIQDAFVHDPTSYAYGLRPLYKKRDLKNLKQEPELIAGKDTELISKLNKNGKTFQYPNLEIIVETKKRRKNSDLTRPDALDDILRIHLHDRGATPFSACLNTLRSQGDIDAPLKNKSASVDRSTLIETAKKASASLGITLLPTQDGSFKYTGNFSKIKQVISEVVPTISYGSLNSCIISAEVVSLQNKDLTTINILSRGGRNNNTEPNGAGFGNIPTRVLPTELTLKTYGCPLFFYSQQFFFDAGTGTTADNIYGITGITHRIEPGSFQTDLKLIGLDGYGTIENVTSKLETIKTKLNDLSSNIKK